MVLHVSVVEIVGNFILRSLWDGTWRVKNFGNRFADVANTLKFRASYGELGNQNTNVWYPTYRLMTLGRFDGWWLQNGSRPNTAKVGDLVSNTLTWETIRTWNVGLDFGFFNNRLTGSFDYYTRYTDGMVGPAPELPLTLGIATPKTNNCDLQTRGWELQIGCERPFEEWFGIRGTLHAFGCEDYHRQLPGEKQYSFYRLIFGRT